MMTQTDLYGLGMKFRMKTDVKGLFYCPKCRTLLPKGEEVCKTCQEKGVVPAPEDLVLLASDSEKEIDSLCALLSAEKIVFQTEQVPTDVPEFASRGLRGGSQVLVPYRFYSDAKTIAKKQGFFFEEEEEDDRSSSAKTEEPLSPRKQKLGKLLVYLSVIAAIVAVVVFSEVIIQLVKGLWDSGAAG